VPGPLSRKPKELLKLKVLGSIIVALFQVLATTPDDPAERAEHELGPVRSAEIAKATPILYANAIANGPIACAR